MGAPSRMSYKWDGQTAGFPTSLEDSPLFDSIPFPLALLDRDGIFRAVNPAWMALGPATPNDSTYLEFCERLCVDETAAMEIQNGIHAVAEGSTAVFTGSFTSDTGILFHVSISPYNGDSRDLLLLTVTPVNEKAVPRGEDQQRQAEKMEAVGRLVGGVAHDFANVLTMISGYSEILLSRMSHIDPLRPELDEIRKAANRGARLTAQLLGFTRGQSVQPRILDLNALVADMERMLRPVIGEYIDLETHLSPALGRIKADAGQMEQVIMNLILNARDAMPSGGRIVIQTENCDLPEEEADRHGVPSGSYVFLSITDTGQGMTPETQRHLFEPFFTTKEKGKGTGLGLSTVHNIVVQNQGCVWAVSAPGQGTTFTICLPLVEATGEAQEPRPIARPGYGNETILVVEDEDGVRRLLNHVLTKRGYTVLEASNAEDALRIFEQHPTPIDLVLTDMVMPRMSGRELADRIKESKPHMKVIFMSGYTDDVLVRTGALSPGMSFLQKPLRPEVLAAKVREALDSTSPIRRNTAA